MKMTRKRDGDVNLPTSLHEAEKAAHAALREYTKARPRGQADLCRKTKILPSVMTRLVNSKASITLDSALLIHVATNGELDAGVLCPSRADVLAAFRTKATTTT